MLLKSAYNVFALKLVMHILKYLLYMLMQRFQQELKNYIYASFSKFLPIVQGLLLSATVNSFMTKRKNVYMWLVFNKLIKLDYGYN